MEGNLRREALLEERDLLAERDLLEKSPVAEGVCGVLGDAGDRDLLGDAEDRDFLLELSGGASFRRRL